MSGNETTGRAETPKLIYLAERHPDLTPAGFTTRWREHARLGMSLERWRNVRRYVHCDPLDVTGLAGLPHAAADGVALVWYRSEASRIAHAGESPERAIMRNDERETFARPVREFATLTIEHPIRASQYRSGEVRVFLFARRRPDLATPDFLARWRRDHGSALASRLAATLPSATYIQNQVRTDRAALGLGLDVDAIDELAIEAAGLAALMDVLSAGDGLAAAIQLARISLLATSTVVLWDTPEPAEPAGKPPQG
ncbi:MAG: hypothetical protein GC150_13430 [Rhizobiales bacterium]|nr:hypothetical protein [Hyphomicrobiales bacterium]